MGGRVGEKVTEVIRDNRSATDWHVAAWFGIKANSRGADITSTRSLLRQANVSVKVDRDVQAVGADKREAQSHSVRLLPFPNVPGRLTGMAATV